MDRIVGTMVACLKCKTIVWAHDDDHGDVRGIVNMFGLPCPNCKATVCFDGWRITAEQAADFGYRDGWTAMRETAKASGMAWKPHEVNRWPVAGGATP